MNWWELLWWNIKRLIGLKDIKLIDSNYNDENNEKKKENEN